MTKRNAANALAFHLGWDIGEVREYRYQPTRTQIPVFSIGDGYMTARPLSKPPKDGDDFTWKRRPDNLLEQDGWGVWESEGEEPPPKMLKQKGANHA